MRQVTLLDPDTMAFCLGLGEMKFPNASGPNMMEMLNIEMLQFLSQKLWWLYCLREKSVELQPDNSDSLSNHLKEPHVVHSKPLIVAGTVGCRHSDGVLAR